MLKGCHSLVKWVLAVLHVKGVFLQFSEVVARTALNLRGVLQFIEVIGSTGLNVKGGCYS